MCEHVQVGQEILKYAHQTENDVAIFQPTNK